MAPTWDLTQSADYSGRRNRLTLDSARVEDRLARRSRRNIDSSFWDLLGRPTRLLSLRDGIVDEVGHVSVAVPVHRHALGIAETNLARGVVGQFRQ